MCNSDTVGAETINRDAVAHADPPGQPQQRILMPITNSGYGIGEKGKYCTEETPLRPISLYGVTKVEAEQAVLDAGQRHQLPAGHGVRHVAAHAHRPAGQRFRLPRRH